ncbi:myosin-2-like [Musa acuminata AAA Group]|uniref:myosin-2-like n=1 Tax=Musa acuminata AAA Group TaxID=214697 RepID=UPI0031D46ADA
MASSFPAIPTVARSVLEEMLDALKLREEKPKDVPPALPARPTMRRRLPSAKKSLPMKFSIGRNEAGSSSKDPGVMEEGARSESREFSIGIKASLEDPEDENGDHSGYVEAEEASDMDHDKLHASRSEELEKQVLKMKTEMRQKEEENVELLQQVQQIEDKWSLCEEKMKSMEELYQKQIESLKVSLAAVQKSLAANDMVKQPGKFDMPADARPPTKHHDSVTGLSKDVDGRNNAVGQLTKEFEKQKQIFEEDARVLSEVKSGQLGSVKKSIEELQKLKVRYAAWKKEYKVRFHDTKASLRKLGKSDVKPKKVGRRGAHCFQLTCYTGFKCCI